MCFHHGVTTIFPYSPFIKQDCFDFIFFHLKNYIDTSCNFAQPVVYCQFYSKLAMLIKYLLFITVHS